jgi:ribosomal protein L31
MCANFIKQSKSVIQLTDGSVITTTYLLENAYSRLSIDSRSHTLWRVDLTKNVLGLTYTNKRVFNFKKRFNKK